MLAAICVAPPAAGQPVAWEIDYGKSRIVFIAKQMGVSVEGEFKKFTATLNFDTDQLSESRADVTVDVASVRTSHPDVEAEVKKSKWFDVARFPTARFEVGSFRHANGDKYEAVARLTLRDATKDVVLPFTLSMADDPAKPGFLQARAVGEVEVQRLDYGIGQDEWRNTNVVANEVIIRIELTARRPR